VVLVLDEVEDDDRELAALESVGGADFGDGTGAGLVIAS
jgi:hypothetical protein